MVLRGASQVVSNHKRRRKEKRNRSGLFLLRCAMAAAEKRHGNMIKLTTNQCLDLELWLDILASATVRTSMNFLTFRDPDVIFCIDACEHGLGGYDLETGDAWRWELPLDLHLRCSLNSLEFLAMYVSLALAFAHGRITPGSCILLQGDSTSAAGWLYRSNFGDEQPFQRWITRAITWLVL